MKKWVCGLSLCIVCLAFFAFFGTRVVYAEETATPTETATGTATATGTVTSTPEPGLTWEPLFSTATAGPTLNYQCCDSMPTYWLTKTPAVWWSSMCSHCLLTQTPAGPVGTPLMGTGTATPTVTPEECEAWYIRGPHYFLPVAGAGSWPGYHTKTFVEPGGKYLRAVVTKVLWYDIMPRWSFSDSALWPNSSIWSNQELGKVMCVYKAGYHDMCDLTPLGVAEYKQNPFAFKETNYSGHQTGTIRQENYGDIEEHSSSVYLMTYFVYEGNAWEQTPEASSRYCCTVHEETEPVTLFELPQFTQSQIVGCKYWNRITIPISDVCETMGGECDDLVIPGVQICMRYMSLGSVTILGVVINLDVWANLAFLLLGIRTLAGMV